MEPASTSLPLNVKSEKSQRRNKGSRKKGNSMDSSGSFLHHIAEAKRLIRKMPNMVRELNISIFNIPTRLQKVFNDSKINTLNDFFTYPDHELSREKNLGRAGIIGFCEMLRDLDAKELENRLKYEVFRNKESNDTPQDNESSIEVILKKFIEQRDNSPITQEEFKEQRKILLRELAKLDAAYLKTIFILLKKGHITQREFDKIKKSLTVFKIK